MKKMQLVTICFLLCAITINTNQNVVKADKKIVVAEGGEKVLTTDTFKTKIEEEKGKKVKIYKAFSDATHKISKLADKTEKAIFVKGIKPGKTQVTLKTTTGKYKYQITVLSKEKIKKKARKMLKKAVQNRQGIQEDFNQDGIEEYYCDGKIFYYDYEKEKVISKRFFSPKECGKIQKIYYSAKRHLLYAQLEGKTAVRFAFFDRKKIIGREHREIYFLKIKDKKGENHYILNDESYDQDDYWYQPYTEEERNRFLKKQIPDAKEIKIRA